MSGANEGQLHVLVGQYGEARAKLVIERRNIFPIGSIVTVFPGKRSGRVVNDCGCPLERLPVLLDSGTVQWFKLADCLPNARLDRQEEAQ